MAKLFYNSSNHTWKCSNCDKNYSLEEVSDLFNHQFFDTEGQLQYAQKGYFTPSHCVDCGIELDEIENLEN